MNYEEWKRIDKISFKFWKHTKTPTELENPYFFSPAFPPFFNQDLKIMLSKLSFYTVPHTPGCWQFSCEKGNFLLHLFLLFLSEKRIAEIRK